MRDFCSGSGGTMSGMVSRKALRISTRSAGANAVARIVVTISAGVRAAAFVGVELSVVIGVTFTFRSLLRVIASCRQFVRSSHTYLDVSARQKVTEKTQVYALAADVS